MLTCASAAELDQKRRNEIQSTIEADPKKLLGKSLDEVSKQLNLEKVPWDKGYTNFPNGELRIYHFPSFSLTMHLVLLPPGIKPRSNQNYSYTQESLQRTGVRWLDGSYPFVRVDNINDSKERMKLYWDAVGRGLEQRKKTGRYVNPLANVVLAAADFDSWPIDKAEGGLGLEMRG